jgi:hypothetical protein
MKDQVHIRNAEAAELARTLARQTGKTITEVVLDALRRYQPPREESPADRKRRVARLQRLLEKDWARGRREPEITIEDMYDEETGLPK